MHNQNLPQKQEIKDSSIVLSDKEISIAGSVYKLNMAIPYPLTNMQIEDWSKTINRLMPDLEPEVLQKVIDEFLLDNVEWDRSKGIQNIFNQLRPKGYSPDVTN